MLQQVSESKTLFITGTLGTKKFELYNQDLNSVETENKENSERRITRKITQELKNLIKLKGIK